MSIIFRRMRICTFAILTKCQQNDMKKTKKKVIMSLVLSKTKEDQQSMVKNEPALPPPRPYPRKVLS